MLRQALDAAEREKEAEEAQQQQQQDAEDAAAAAETTSLLQRQKGAGDDGGSTTRKGPQGTDEGAAAAAAAAAGRGVQADAASAAAAVKSPSTSTYGSVAGASSRTDTDDDDGDVDEEYDEEEGDDDDEDDDDDDDESDEDDEDEEEDDSDEDNKRSSFPSLVWNALKNAFVVVANVENLYDTPPPSEHANGVEGDGHHAINNGNVDDLADRQRALRRKRNAIVFFWFVVLATSYAAERSTFKLLVDRTGPFRLFSVEMVTSTHCLLLGSGWIVAKIAANRSRRGKGSSADGGRAGEVGLGISIVDVGLMALMDTVALLLAFLTGVHVPPSLTVILVQLTLPLTAFLTQFVHPDGRCSCNSGGGASEGGGSSMHSIGGSGGGGGGGGRNVPLSSSDHATAGGAGGGGGQYGATTAQGDDDDPFGDFQRPRPEAAANTVISEEGMPLPKAGGLSAEHVWGSLIIFVACTLALLPAFISIADPDFFVYADAIPLRTACNTLIYASSCVPAAASQLYKEHVFLRTRQPVDATRLNFLLSLFQFIFASIVSPLVFTLQGLGVSSKSAGELKTWTNLYPSSKFSDNFLDGMKCFLRILPEEDQESKYFDDASCDFVLGLTVFHAISIVAVGVAVDKIVNAGATKVMYRGMSAGIIVAVLVMHAYDMQIPEFSYGPIVDGLNLACLILLILGSEVYHRVALQGATFETTYPVIETFYEED